MCGRNGKHGGMKANRWWKLNPCSEQLTGLRVYSSDGGPCRAAGQGKTVPGQHSQVYIYPPRSPAVLSTFHEGEKKVSLNGHHPCLCRHTTKPYYIAKNHNIDISFRIYVCMYVYVRDHKSSLKQHRYICSNSQQYIVWVKIIDFYIK